MENLKDKVTVITGGTTKLTDAPFAEKKFMTVNGQRMAYIDEGEGDAIVFSHGNPTSSFLWRNIMPAVQGMGRLIACDLVGHGDSDKLPQSGPDSYSYAEQRSYMMRCGISWIWATISYSLSTTGVLHSASTTQASTPIASMVLPTWNR